MRCACVASGPVLVSGAAVGARLALVVPHEVEAGRSERRSKQEEQRCDLLHGGAGLVRPACDRRERMGAEKVVDWGR